MRLIQTETEQKWVYRVFLLRSVKSTGMSATVTVNRHYKLKRLCHGQKSLHLFSDSGAYIEQMGPIPSPNGSLDLALSNAHI